MHKNVAAALCLMGCTLFACQEAREPTTTLTQAQWEEVRQHILDAPPAKMTHTIGANFGSKIELLGLNIEPASPKAGQEVTITYYWKALANMNVNWQVFVHLDHKGPPPSRQGLDHHPVRDLYQTTRWKEGQIIQDVQKVLLKGDYPDGEAVLWIGLWDPSSSKRLELSNVEKVANDRDNRVRAASVSVSGKKVKREKPKVHVARPASGAVTIDGKLDESAWKGAARTLLGGTRGGPGPKVGQTWFKVLYDDKNIYFALHAKDPDAWGSLQTRDSETWTEEVLEIFIDPDGDAKDYVELQITPMNVIFDARFPAKLGKGKGSREEQINAAKSWNSKLVSAVSIDGTLNNPSDVDKSWTAEISIPIADLPGPPPKAGTSWKLNVYRFDKARDKEGKPGTAQTAWAWAQPRGSFHNVERFGSLRFLNAKGIKPTNSVLDPKGLRKLPEKPKPSTKVGRPTGEVEPDKPE